MTRKWLSLGLGLLLVVALASGVSAGSAGGYGGGGPLVGMLRLDLGGLNDVLKSEGYEPLNGDMFIIGGGGSGGTLYWNVGGWGFGGEVATSNGNNEAVLMVAAGGFNLNRTLPIGPITLQTGLMVGGGSADLRIVTTASPTVEEAVHNRYETNITNDFFAVAPSVGVRIKLADFVFLQADGGYLATIGDWKFQDRSIAGLPRIGGPMVKVGIVFGGSTK